MFSSIYTRFEGEYWMYLTEKRVKEAERGDAKMVAGLLSQAHRGISGVFNRETHEMG